MNACSYVQLHGMALWIFPSGPMPSTVSPDMKRLTTNLLSLLPGNRRHKFQGVYPKLPLPVE